MPGLRNGIVYAPSAVVTPTATSPVCVLTAVTVAPGVARPLGSVTRPVSVARNSCADADAARSSAASVANERIHQVEACMVRPPPRALVTQSLGLFNELLTRGPGWFSR